MRHDDNNKKRRPEIPDAFFVFKNKEHYIFIDLLLLLACLSFSQSSGYDRVISA